MKQWRRNPRFRSMTTPALVSQHKHYTFLDTRRRSERINALKKKLDSRLRNPATPTPASGLSAPASESTTLTTPTPQSQTLWSAMLVSDMSIRWSIVDDASQCNTVMVQRSKSNQILAARVDKYGSIPAKTKQTGWRIMEDRFCKHKRLLLVRHDIHRTHTCTLPLSLSLTHTHTHLHSGTNSGDTFQDKLGSRRGGLRTRPVSKVETCGQGDDLVQVGGQSPRGHAAC